jgi:HEAT repeat protein
MSHPNARIQAQDQLMQLGSLSVRVLLSMARASEVELRLEAASALGALKSKDAQPTLRMLAQDPDPRVSEAATEALKAMGVEA